MVWQRFNPAEPLLPLGLFRDRNFSLSNVAISLVGFAIVAMPLPLAFYYQVARGLTPTQAALMLVPMALVTGIAAPFVGRLIDRVDPKWIAFSGFVITALSLWWTASLITPDQELWVLLIPSGLLGLGLSGIWAPLASSATRNLPPAQAGAGSGVYNTTRQVGSVLGSAAIAALLNARLAAELPGFDTQAAEQASGGTGGLAAAGARRLHGRDGAVDVAAGARLRRGRDRRAVLREAEGDGRLGRRGALRRGRGRSVADAAGEPVRSDALPSEGASEPAGGAPGSRTRAE